jgi:hypothetical protein
MTFNGHFNSRRDTGPENGIFHGNTVFMSAIVEIDKAGRI